GWICTHFSGTRRPIFLEIASAEVSVEEAVTSYLFNSQLLCLPGGGMLLAVARECAEHPKVWAAIRRIVEDPANPISDVRVFDLRESMRNGGGPACLRLRVVLDENQRKTVNAASWINAESCGTLKTWVERHYRDRITFEDLADPQLLDESRSALDQLTHMLNIGSIYDFQH
ncbi:MAG: N-succinylarginine dihydrolase, partial [Stenotrophobium sp.]